MRAARSAMRRFHRDTAPGAAPTMKPPLDAPVESITQRVSSDADGCRRAHASVERRQRVDTWRRRVLLKKGARFHAACLARGDRCALAVLDSHGIVVAWYDPSRDASQMRTHVIDRHVGQFYVAADLAANLPGLNLLSAAMWGNNTQRGWRRQPGGAVIWATTAIGAIVLNDGRLQGFTHVMRPADGPRANPPSQMPRSSLRQIALPKWGMGFQMIFMNERSSA